MTDQVGLQTIKLWDTDVSSLCVHSCNPEAHGLKTKALISSTPAHEDFVKVLLVIPSLNLLVSGSSDKVVRFWHVYTHRSLTMQ